MGRRTISALEILMAVRLVQPGKLGDVVEGLQRLIPEDLDYSSLKPKIANRLHEFRELDLVCLYTGQRYMLTDRGRMHVEAAGIKLQIDERRMFLLKETRRATSKTRSGARDGLLEQ